MLTPFIIATNKPASFRAAVVLPGVQTVWWQIPVYVVKPTLSLGMQFLFKVCNIGREEQWLLSEFQTFASFLVT